MWTKPIREINHLVKLGRQLETENGQMLLWPLSGAEIQIQCKEMYVELEGLGDGQASWFCVWADGAVIARFPVQKGKHWYPVLLGMDDTVSHRITLCHDTQPIKGDGMRCILCAIRSDGKVLEAEKRAYNIEFIGDSLTTGEGCTGPVCAKEWKTAWMGPSYGYAQRVGEKLNARAHLISQSGWGVCSDWAGVVENNIPDIYEQFCGVVPEGKIAYDFPVHMDALVLNLGTNDCSALDTMKEEERPAHREKIVREAAAFLRRLRAIHPDAYILWTYGMCGGDLGPDLERAVNTVRTEGDQKVGYAHLPACPAEETGSLQHPGIANHEQAAVVITEHLKKHAFSASETHDA